MQHGKPEPRLALVVSLDSTLRESIARRLAGEGLRVVSAHSTRVVRLDDWAVADMLVLDIDGLDEVDHTGDAQPADVLLAASLGLRCVFVGSEPALSRYRAEKRERMAESRHHRPDLVPASSRAAEVHCD